MGVGGSKQWHTHMHTHIVPRDTTGGWSLGQGSDAILTHVGVVGPLMKLMGYEHREDAVGVGEQAMEIAHTHAPTQCPS